MSKVIIYKGNPVAIRIGCYQSPPNLYVGLIDDYDGEPVAGITMNFDIDMPPYCSAVKDYSENEGMLLFLLENGFGIPTGEGIESGYVTLPVFRFDKEMLRELDPGGCAMYEKSAYKKLLSRAEE